MATMSLYAIYGLPKVTITSNWLVNIIVAAIFTSLGSLFIILRILSATLRGRPFGLDDLAMYLAFLTSIGFTISSTIALRWGIGLHKTEVPPAWSVPALQATYAVEIFYYTALFLLKTSILNLYLRIATGLRGSGLWKGTVATLVLLAVHFATTLVVAGVQCRPLAHYWDPARHPHGACIHITAFFYTTNAFTILSDLLILALPLPTFWRLRRPRAQKAALVAAFAVGALSTLASAVRLYAVRMFRAHEGVRGLEDAAPINTWSFVEIYLGVCCASVPAIKPLFFPPKHESPSQKATMKRTSRRRGGSSSAHLVPLPADQVPDPSPPTAWGSLDPPRTPTARPINDTIALHPLTSNGKDDPPQDPLRSAVLTSSRGSLRNYTLSAAAKAGSRESV